MFGSGQVFLSLSFYAILPVLIIFYYVYKRNKFPEPPRIVLVTFLLGIGTTFPLEILIIAVEGFAESLNLGIESSNFFMSFIRAAFLEELMKFFVIIFYCLHLDHFEEPMDALVYGVAASLGFAVIENWEYVLGASKDGIEYAKDVALIRSFTAVPLHALAGVFMGFFLMDAIFQKHNRKFYLFLSLFFPVCLHGLYDLILFSEGISDYYIYILLVVFLIRAYFIFSKESKAQLINNNKKVKYLPRTSDIFFVVLVTFLILFVTNYFIDYVMYK
jgi:RsiW-degrading membrane proteinase PrsW (M82 family)